MGSREQRRADIGARVERAEPEEGSVGAEAMLGRVLEGVLDEQAEPVRAGRYIILEAVGRGGVGEVHAAYDPELDRRVAIKLVRGDTAGWDDLENRMLREARAMAKIRHPNVVAIYDVGRFRDQIFIAMELIEGLTLSAWTRTEERSWAELQDVFIQAGRGLAAVHDAGLVQRDFKPANVLVGNDGVVKILDFGLARAVANVRQQHPSAPAAGGALLDEEFTRAGFVAGTPAYMAPEQCRGDHIDAEADQFAFCVALYEALYGQRPFPGSDLKLRTDAITAGQLAPPSNRRSVPPWLHKTVLKGLSPTPQGRHPSMSALVAELQHDKIRKARTTIAVITAILLTVLATSAFFLAYEPSVSPEQLAEVEALEGDARAAADAHIFVYPPLDEPQRPTAYSSTLALEHTEGPAAEPARKRAAALRTKFSLDLTELGDTYGAREGGARFAADFYATAVLFDPSNDKARELSLLTTAQLEAMRARVERGEFEEAELVSGASLAALAEPDDAVRRQKVERLRKRRPDAPASTMASLDTLVGAAPARVTSKSPAAKLPPDVARPPVTADPRDSEAPSNSTAKSPSAGEANDPRGAAKLAKEGLAALRAHELKRAETLLNRAIAKNRKNGSALGGLASLHFELGRYNEAVKYGKRAVTAAPKNARYRLTLADAYYKVLRYDDARRTYLEAKKLGSSGAQRGLDRVNAKLGTR